MPQRPANRLCRGLWCASGWPGATPTSARLVGPINRCVGVCLGRSAWQDCTESAGLQPLLQSTTAPLTHHTLLSHTHTHSSLFCRTCVMHITLHTHIHTTAGHRRGVEADGLPDSVHAGQLPQECAHQAAVLTLLQDSSLQKGVTAWCVGCCDQW